jgi:hypothetical protein
MDENSYKRKQVEIGIDDRLWVLNSPEITEQLNLDVSTVGMYDWKIPDEIKTGNELINRKQK